MATVARTVRRLSSRDAGAVLDLLDGDQVANAFLRSELRLGALTGGAWWGVERRGLITAALLAGPLVIPCVPDGEDAQLLAEVLDRHSPPRMMVGPREQVHALHRGRRLAPEPREVRDPQPLMAVGRGRVAAAGSPEVRRAELADLDLLVVAAAAMHREEMGIDPLAIDPAGWRARMAVLIDRGWSWVWMEGDRVLFKAELSAWTAEVVQVQGVYTAPAERGRGVATRGLAAVCEALHTEVPTCSLYVNHFNLPALRVYTRLGFESVGEFATLIL
ncbi:MAG TPA: GNAT family N-acetyltransferase [Candidatus Dormibacteraeota bacterium]|nr:GNAT family N-acetyltransferase [Candidatus Dormibacteraeota bacterium]